MGFLSSIFKKKSNTSGQGVEDFMSLTRVYFQSVLAVNLGITNMRYLPDIANFKRLFKIPTQNGRIGLGEKTAAKKMLMQDYGLSENYFKEIDSSVRKHCRNQNDAQPYMFLYQGFLTDLMMFMSNKLQWKIRIPSVFKNTIKGVVEKTVHDVCTKPMWKKEDEQKTAMSVRTYKERLGYSESWMSEYVYTVLMLAKKEKNVPQKGQEGK